MTRTLPLHVRVTATELEGKPVTVCTVPNLDVSRRFSWAPDTNSVARYWTPIVGPSCIAIARSAVMFDGHTMPARDLARCVGLKLPLFVRACDRLHRFGLGTLARDDVGWRLSVESPWPYLSKYQTEQLPPVLRDAYLRTVVR